MSWWYPTQLDRIETTVTALSTKLDQLQKKANQIMALVELDQSTLDDLSAALTDVGSQLAAEIAALQTALPTADLSGVNAALAALQALEVPAPTPPA